MKKIFLFPLLLLAVILQGCGGKHVPPLQTPSRPLTGKTIYEEAAIPPTQRPYKIDGKTYYPLPTSHGYSERGIASWYGSKFHGRKTSNGEVYDMYGRTAAHKTLPMNTHVLVENLENSRETVLRINDRGPFVKGRIIDLSLTAARELGIIKNGTANVRVTALGQAEAYQQGATTIERFLPHQDFQTGEFYVQIGSFTNRDNALRLQKKMTATGKKTMIRAYDRGDKLFYRVQVHAGTTLNAARTVEQELNIAGFGDAFVIAR